MVRHKLINFDYAKYRNIINMISINRIRLYTNENIKYQNQKKNFVGAELGLKRIIIISLAPWCRTDYYLYGSEK